MCGIIGALAQRNVAPILLEGLKRMEYRGYDSSGMAVLGKTPNHLQQLRRLGKVSELERCLKSTVIKGRLGIAHTRWATHGKPSEANAHPHVSRNEVAVVHNGIIENFELLKAELIADGYTFHSETDTEVIAHLIHHYYQQHKALRAAVHATVKRLKGAYALGIIHADEPNRLIGYRSGSPLIVGIGIEEHFIASDTLALFPTSKRFIYLQENSLVDIIENALTIYDENDNPIDCPSQELDSHHDIVDRGPYRHYMLKEIFEQPAAIYKTLSNNVAAWEEKLGALFKKTEHIHIVACGTSHHAAMVARHWIENSVGIPCQTEIASEFRYRHVAIPPNTLFITLSQSGETADTLAALRKAKRLNYLTTLGICNVPNSPLARECDHILMTKAGAEIGVASTKAFTTQLTVLRLITHAIMQEKFSDKTAAPTQCLADSLSSALRQLPHYIEKVLTLEDAIKTLAADLANKHHALFLGRGAHYPIAKEGALKLKEISYIHAEAYPAGELKHGPIALIDGHIPTIVLMPRNELTEKLKSTINEILARGGELIVFADQEIVLNETPLLKVLPMPSVPDSISPIVYVIALQLMSYHAAVFKGTDVDQPRNLAKAVTVE